MCRRWFITLFITCILGSTALYGCATIPPSPYPFKTATLIPSVTPRPTQTHVTPTPTRAPLPTLDYQNGFTHFTPPEGVNFYLEFDYPSYWELSDRFDLSSYRVSLSDPRKPTPEPTPEITTTPGYRIQIIDGQSLAWPSISLHALSCDRLDWTIEMSREANKAENSLFDFISDTWEQYPDFSAQVLISRVNGGGWITFSEPVIRKEVFFESAGYCYWIIGEFFESETGQAFDLGFQALLDSIVVGPSR